MSEARMSELRGLLADVERSRAGQQKARRESSSTALVAANRTHLRALETYAAALDRFGWPLPPKMRVELQLHRTVSGALRRSS